MRVIVVLIEWGITLLFIGHLGEMTVMIANKSFLASKGGLMSYSVWNKKLWGNQIPQKKR